MPIMKFYLLPIYSFTQAASIKILQIDGIVERIKKAGDEVYIPVEFYTTKDKEKNDFLSTISDNMAENHDAIELLMEIVFKNKQTNSSYEELIENALGQEDYREEYLGFITECINPNSPINQLSVTNVTSLARVYRYIAGLFENYQVFFGWKKRCYPELLFSEDAFVFANKIGTFRDNYKDINTCLSVLNDRGKGIYEKVTEDEAISSIQALSGIKCSGKGSNESSTFKKRIKYWSTPSSSVQYEISCIPHFKLDAAFSNKRIHFCWGRNEISNHRIIVVHVGEHWTENNSQLSDIKDF